jgi:hypothetical protein
MRIVKFNPTRNSAVKIENVKAEVDKKNPKEIEIVFRDAGEVYYVKMGIGDLFNAILLLLGK